MSQVVLIKLSTASANVGPFTIKDNIGNVLATDVSRETLKAGISYTVDDDATVITVSSTGDIVLEKNYSISEFPSVTYNKTNFTTKTPNEVPYRLAAPRPPKIGLWKHLKNPFTYNRFYGVTEPYIIEYPFAYNFQDEILRNVKDYTKVYRYVDNGDGVLSDFSKYETDDYWFNKAILYNGQQNSGVLQLYPKTSNNLSVYSLYPGFNTNNKSILFTKSDNFYQYNTFWSVLKNPLEPQFIRTCKNLSIDKEINQDNMDYSRLTYNKAPLRAKELKIRHIMDHLSTHKFVSQFIITPTQNSE